MDSTPSLSSFPKSSTLRNPSWEMFTSRFYSQGLTHGFTPDGHVLFDGLGRQKNPKQMALLNNYVGGSSYRSCLVFRKTSQRSSCELHSESGFLPRQVNSSMKLHEYESRKIPQVLLVLLSLQISATG